MAKANYQSVAEKIDTYWSDAENDDTLLTCGAGYNAVFDVTERVKKYLKGVFNRDFEVGLFTMEDLPSRMQDKWLPLKPELLPTDKWNSTCSTSMGLHESDGVIMHKKNVVCIMDKHYRENVFMKKYHEHTEKAIARGVKGKMTGDKSSREFELVDQELIEARGNIERVRNEDEDE